MKTYTRIKSGFTAIELMIVVAIVAVIIALAAPAYNNYTIRAKVSEGLNAATEAQHAIENSCLINPYLYVGPGDNSAVAYQSRPSLYVEKIVIGQQGGGSCAGIAVSVFLQNTGAEVDPILVLNGTNVPGEKRMNWSCQYAQGEKRHIPTECREVSTL